MENKQLSARGRGVKLGGGVDMGSDLVPGHIVGQDCSSTALRSWSIAGPPAEPLAPCGRAQQVCARGPGATVSISGRPIARSGTDLNC